MTTPTMRDGYAQRVRHELEQLVKRDRAAATAPLRTPVMSSVGRLRPVLRGVLALLVVIPAAVFALSSSVARFAGNEQTPAVTARPGAAGFDGRLDLVAISATTADLEDGVQEYGQGEGWFETLDGESRFVIEIGDRRIHVPLTPTEDGATSDSTPDTRFENARCGADQDCMLRAWMARFFQQPVTFTRTSSGFTAAAGTDVITGTSTNRPHRYPTVTPVTSNRRTLLTYPAQKDGAQMMALNGGDLTTNDAGCLLGGNDVLVLPDRARLNPDGSIDLDGKHHQQGQPLNIAGGQGPAPGITTCGQDLNYWYY